MPASPTDSMQCMPSQSSRPASSFKASDVPVFPHPPERRARQEGCPPKKRAVKKTRVFKIDPPQTGLVERNRVTTQRIVTKAASKGLYDPRQMDRLHCFLEECERICNHVKAVASIVTTLKKSATKTKKSKCSL